MDPRHADLLTDAVEAEAAARPPRERTAWVEAIARRYESVRRAADIARGGRPAAAWYTPDAVVQAVLDDALPGQGGHRRGRAPSRTVVDPACGTGHFLVAAGARLRSAGPRTLRGMDLDPLAVAIARVRLRLAFGGSRAAWASAVRCGDALAPGAWDRTVDVVVGNPPFLGQLARGSARSASERRSLKARFGGAVSRYADTAAAFLLLATELAPAGTCALVLPVSTLSATDAGPVRAEAARRLGLRSVRFLPEDAFAASVRTCVVTLAARSAPTVRAIAADGRVAELPAAAVGTDWGATLAAARSVPPSAISSSRGLIGDLAAVTADFRQHYYGMRGLVEESRGRRPGREAPALVTVGAIDAARLRWGSTPVRIHGKAFAAPVVRRERLRAHPVLGPWLAARGVPKVLVATQTRALEAWVDERAHALPSTPVLTAVPRRRVDLWKAGAAILAPPIAAEAWWRHAGAGMSSRAIRISASQLRALPAPGNAAAWTRGAVALRAWQGGDPAARLRFANAMCSAYGVPTGAARRPLVAWWLEAIAGSGPAACSVKLGLQAAGRG